MLTRWNLKQIRDCEWFKKKHPIIKEDLARLPSEVVSNECGSTFRMINFLEKYCESLNESHINTQATAVLTNYAHADDQVNGAGMNQVTDQESTSHYIPHSETEPSSKTHSYKNAKNQNGATLNSQQSSTQYSQATKVKKNHCSLM